jgi:predicted DCC family thiol-disulfide oxidoreductase YuxK
LTIHPEKPIVLFDGACNFCNASVNFISKHNSKDDFIFIPLQSPEGKKLLHDHHLSESYMESIVLIEHHKAFLKSTAALRISKKLDGFYRLAFVFNLVPQFIRDKFYDWIAAHRGTWFRDQKTCEIPGKKS